MDLVAPARRAIAADVDGELGLAPGLELDAVVLADGDCQESYDHRGRVLFGRELATMLGRSLGNGSDDDTDLYIRTVHFISFHLISFLL